MTDTIFIYLFDLATYPLDLTKTRLQIQGEGNKLKANGIDATKKVRFNFVLKTCFDFLCFTLFHCSQYDKEEEEEKRNIAHIYLYC